MTILEIIEGKTKELIIILATAAALIIGFFFSRDYIHYRWHRMPEWFQDRAQWWNPDISWQNKYKYGDHASGPKFWGSTTIFVAITDASHMLRAITVICFSLAVATGWVTLIVYLTIYSLIMEILF